MTDLPNARGTRVVLHEFPAAATPFEQLTRARRMADELVKAQADDIAISCHAGDPASMAAWAEAVVSALLAQAVELPSYKTDGAQGARADATQIRARYFLAPRQTRRLPGAGPCEA